jgi:hypothetical protein
VEEEKASMTTSQKAEAGQYKTFAECWTDAEGDFGSMGKFNCCEEHGVPYPNPSDGEGYLFCMEHT